MSADASGRGAGIRCYAPIVLVSAFAIAWYLNGHWPLPIETGSPGLVLLTAGWVLAAAGTLLMFAGLLTLVRAKTTFFPDRESNRLVMQGPFALSRNPIYVADLAIYVGLSLAANIAWPILLLPIVWIVMRLYIGREERYLTAKFGDNYAEYRRRVRRWL